MEKPNDAEAGGAWLGEINLDRILRRSPNFGLLSRRARVIAAMQSPTLLSNWSTSDLWDLQIANLGDHEGLQETQLFDGREWDREVAEVKAVLVTSPLQLETARRIFPHSKKIWILHNGQGHLLPPELIPQVDGIITLSKIVLSLQRTQRPELLELPAWIIPPHYIPRPAFGWASNFAWTMKSRPSTRDSRVLALLMACERRLKGKSIRLNLFGQDAPQGFLDNEKRLRLYAACSCYVSTLPPWAGFGLAEHECMAAGVPLAGLIWGDLGEAGVYLPSLTSDIDTLAEVIESICSDRIEAKKISDAGLQYISDYVNRKIMDTAIERFVCSLGNES